MHNVPGVLEGTRGLILRPVSDTEYSSSDANLEKSLE